MAVANFDLASETVEAIRASDRQHLWHWMSRQIGFIALGFVLLVPSIMLFWLMFATERLRGLKSVAEAVIFAGVCLAFGVLIIAVQYIKLIRGTPKSELTAKGTLEKFIGDTLGGQGSDGLESYVCLLCQARRAAKSLEEFQAYWARIIQEIQQKLADTDFAEVKILTKFV